LQKRLRSSPQTASRTGPRRKVAGRSTAKRSTSRSASRSRSR
jgi:hypothetical protein